MLKLCSSRSLIRCSWKKILQNNLSFQCEILEKRLKRDCQYIHLETFSGQYRVLKKFILRFPVQCSTTGLCNYEFRRCYSRKKTSGVAAGEVSDDEDEGDSDEEEDEGDSAEDEDQNELAQGYKTVMKTVRSLRLDTALKTGFDLTNRIVERDFYAGNLRLNGERVTRKGISVHEGDEIDVVKELFPANENFLVVNRVVVKRIGKIIPTDQRSTVHQLSNTNRPVKLHVFKALVIENYEDKWP